VDHRLEVRERRSAPRREVGAVSVACVKAMEQSELYSLYESDPAPIVSFLDYLREAYDLPAPTRILDVGCGPGRLLRPLAESGWDVTGVEPDPDYAVAAERVAQSIPGVRFRRAGLMELEESGAFDLVALVNGPLSYVLNPGDRGEALRRCHRALRPGGVLFLDLANFPWVLKNYRKPEDLELEVRGTKVVRKARHEIDYHSGHFTHHDEFEWTGSNGTVERLGKTHRMAMVTYPEIEYFLLELGFTDLATFNSFRDRGPARLTGKRLMVSARRG